MAGGSGIVPLMAMLRARRLAGSRAPFRLVYSVRARRPSCTPTSWRRWRARRLRGWTVELSRTRGRAPEAWGRARWVGSGRSSSWRRSGGRAAEAAFVCGPTGFVEAVADGLAVGGVDPGVIKTERFGPTGG